MAAVVRRLCFPYIDQEAETHIPPLAPPLTALRPQGSAAPPWASLESGGTYTRQSLKSFSSDAIGWIP